jgi:hypothetical protein
MSAMQQRACDLAAAMWIYTSNLPFGVLDSGHAHEFLKAVNPGYKPPGRKALGGTLLDACYSNMLPTIKKKISSHQNINFYVDESTNIRKERVITMAAESPAGGAFYLKTDPIGTA